MIVQLPNGQEAEFPDSMSQSQIESVLRKQFGSPTMLEEFGTGMGRAARAGIQGVSNIGGIVADPFLQMMGVNSSPKAREQALTQMGLPEYPTTGRSLYDAAEVASGAGVVGAASKLSNVAKFLGDSPFLQGVTSLVANNAQDVAKGSGIENPLALGAIGMTAGVGTGLGAGTMGTLGKRVTDSLTDSGQRAIGGQILKKFATNPESAVASLEASAPTIKGSMPMTAGASRDMGLAGLETAVRGLDSTNRIGQRISLNNVARLGEFDRIAGSKAKIDAAEIKRDSITDPMRDSAFSNAAPLDANSVIAQVKSILDDPSKRRGSVFDAIDFVVKGIKQAKNADGTIDPQALYAVRKDMRAASLGKFSGEKKDLKLASKELDSSIGMVDEAIEAVAPGYRDYLTRYAKQSKPINQMETLQEVRNKAVRGTADLNTGEPILQASTFRNEVSKVLGDSKNPLSTTQNRILNKLVSDIDAGLAATSPGVKVPGSDTFKNMTFANIIGKTVGDNIPSSNKTLTMISKPFKWLANYTDDEVRTLLVDAMLDPKLAADMMRKASYMEAQTLSNNLKRKAQASGLGSAFAAE